jgi:ABC-2 type transport system permease protein
MTGKNTFIQGVFVIAKKNILLYYSKPPVLIAGVLFPVFFLLAFVVGREMDPRTAVPCMLAMVLFLTSTAVGPLITPWERKAKTYERLISSPVSHLAIIFGDIISGACFGILLFLLATLLGTLATSTALPNFGILLPAALLAGFCFASLGTLLASVPTDNPSQVMMSSSVVKFPLLFTSGIFMPLAEMPAWSKPLVLISPLSYCTDLLSAAFGATPYFSYMTDLAALSALTVIFTLASRRLQWRMRAKAL